MNGQMFQPVSAWIKLQLGLLPHPLVVGVSGMQGIGKSTLCAQLVEDFTHQGFNVLSISIDDFYLTRAEQQSLADQNPENPLLQQRGYPGTHDLSLGVNVLQALLSLKAGETAQIPVYDKSAYQGKGDRLPEAQWKNIEGPIDLILFEGWMSGFVPALNEAQLNPALATINKKLAEYSSWWSLVDRWVFLDPMQDELVVDWRVEAEEKMKAQGKAGMTTAEIRAYAEKFVQAYELYLPIFRDHLKSLDDEQSLILRIQKDRSVE